MSSLLSPIFLFPGQGSQSLGMAKDLYNEFLVVRETFEEASDTLRHDMVSLCFNDPDQLLNLTQYTQPAILIVSVATFRVLQKLLAIFPTAVAGHSLGEYSALVCLGAISYKDALQAVHFRGQFMQQAVPVGSGAMAAYLGSEENELHAICQQISTPERRVEIANYNSPGQFVLSGHTEAIEHACKLIAEKKLGRTVTLPVSAPFHSSLMQPAAKKMAEYLEKISLESFSGKIIANVDGKIHTSQTYLKQFLVKQMAYPVLWTQTLATIHTAYKDALWVEVGPGKVLQGLAKKTYSSQPCLGTQTLVTLQDTLRSLSTKEVH